ncbi:Short chain dehydrogenase [Lachnellula hyalina]|uniref:Short chain dehydrogenase n=1 Tax=Lachnellula hyalina TaxID=1316788 RepID=A0A8H8R1B3_9HELO|nr:Short chain dehydrogenase [Lachnellula hyalina]TVY26628.1 Short chain dehydrogenase [Lachnellula hyalina]
MFLIEQSNQPPQTSGHLTIIMAAPFPSPTSTWHTKTHQSISPTRPELSAKGKTVLITGGGTGIGAETAHHFAKAGASRIALLGRREQPLLDTKASIEHEFADVEVFVASADVTKKGEVDAAFAKFVGSGKINVLVSNAAMIGLQETIKDADGDKFLEGIQQNLKGSFIVAQAFLRYASTDAVAIDINSSTAHLNFTPKFAPYCIAKLAIFRLWDSVAFENPEISVFHVQPGIIRTAMNEEAGGVDAVGFQDDVSLPASFSVWLASPEARFLKGKFLWANWDVDELKARAKEIEASTQLDIGLIGWPFGGPSWQSNWNS